MDNLIHIWDNVWTSSIQVSLMLLWYPHNEFLPGVETVMFLDGMGKFGFHTKVFRLSECTFHSLETREPERKDLSYSMEKDIDSHCCDSLVSQESPSITSLSPCSKLLFFYLRVFKWPALQQQNNLGHTVIISGKIITRIA